jgi:hypothetical protein
MPARMATPSRCMLLQVSFGPVTEMRDQVMSNTVRLLRGMGEMPTMSVLDEPHITVGLDAKVDEIVKLLTRRAAVGVETSMVLLHGMGGSGKTTLAKAVFSHLHERDPTLPCCFLSLDPDMKEGDLMQKQQQLLKELACEAGVTLNTPEHGQQLLARLIAGQKVLLVVDNVWDDRLELLLPNDFMQLLGGGSMVLAASREVGASRQLWPTGAVLLETACLAPEQAIELFCRRAFPGLPISLPASSWAEYIEQSQAQWASQILAVVKMCAGLPMALELAGRHFAACDDKDAFSSRFRQACSEQKASRVHSVRTLFGSMQLSWNVLKPEEQDDLLDVALMLKGQPWDWVQHHCGYGVLGQLCNLGLVKQHEHISAVHDTVSFFCSDADAIGCLPQRKVVHTSSELLQVRCPPC